MTRYDQRLIDHPVRVALAALVDKLGELSPETVESMDDAAGEGIRERGVEVANYVRGLLDSADARLVASTTLDQLNTHVSEADQHLSQVLAGQPTYAGNIDTALDQLLVAAVGVATVATLPARQASEVGAKLGSAIDAKLKEFGTEQAALADELSQLEQAREQAATTEQAADQERAAALDAQVAQITQAVDAEKTRLEQLLPSFQEQFSDARSAQDEQWQELTASLEEESKSAVAAIETNGAELTAKLEERSDNALKDAEEKRERVEALYGLITDKATSGAFQTEADSQKTQADDWRSNAIKLGIISAIFAIGAVVFAGVDADGSTTSHISALVVAVLISGLTAYAAKQSGSHRDREVRARRLQLELTAFGPFTDTMLDEEASSARQEYAKRLFRGADETSIASNAEADQVTLAQTLIESVVDALKSKV